jgi:hypothetical protein
MNKKTAQRRILEHIWNGVSVLWEETRIMRKHILGMQVSPWRPFTLNAKSLNELVGIIGHPIPKGRSYWVAVRDEVHVEFHYEGSTS